MSPVLSSAVMRHQSQVGTNRRRLRETRSMDQFPTDADMGSLPAPSDPFDTLELGRPDRGRPRLPGRVGRALPGAIAGVLLVGAIAFGASTASPDLSGTSSGQAAGGAQGAGGVAGNGSITAY